MPILTEFIGPTKSKIKRNRTSENSKASDVILLSDEEDSLTTSKATLKKQPPAPAKKTIGKRGRPSDPSVWNYFNYDKEVDKCTCRNCLKQIDGFHQQNAKSHRKHHHPDDFAECEAAESAKKKAKVAEPAPVQKKHVQPAVNAALKKPYPVTSPRYKQIVRQIALTIATKTMSANTVEHPQFKGLVCLLDARAPTPGRTAIRKETGCIYLALIAAMKKSPLHAKRISLTADIWSKKAMTESFLGITAQKFRAGYLEEASEDS